MSRDNTSSRDRPELEARNGDKNPAAVELGRLGGLKGGPARAASLSPERRKEIASIAGRAARNKKSA